MEKANYRTLCQKIEHYNKLYHAQGKSEISDKVYDMLYLELETMEKDHPELVQPWSPTQMVGHASLSNDFTKTKHKKPMLSLKNSYNQDDLTSWIDMCSSELGVRPLVVCEAKFDGLSIELVYIDGCLTRAVTRGDGKVGDDVTNNVMTINDIPKVLYSDDGVKDIPKELVVRGEIFMKFSDLVRANEVRDLNGDSRFVNARNAAAGILRSKRVSDVRKYNLSCFVFELTEGDLYDSHIENMAWMKLAGLPIFDRYAVIDGMTDGDIFEPVEYWGKAKGTLDFPVDGLVYKIDLLSSRKKMGFRSKDPRWAIAYKFDTEKVATKLLDIINQVGRTGAITPVAVLEPVIIDGTTVKRASLHNYELVREMGLCIGDIVEVEKAAEIIPQVVKVISSDDTCYEPMRPTNCSLCDSDLFFEVLKDGKVGKNLICSGNYCPAKIGGIIKHFVSRDGMNIVGLGEKVIDVLLENKIISSMSCIFRLKDKRDELEALPRFGKKKVDNLISAIEASKSPSLENFIYSMGIPHVGKGGARRLAEHFKTIGALLACEDLSIFAGIEDVGELTASHIHEWVMGAGHSVLMLIIKEFLINVQPLEEIQPMSTPNSAFGKIFVATGKLSRGRKEIQADIQAAGGKIGSGVSKKTDYLVCGEKAGSKKAKAEKLGVKIISEDELIVILGG